MKIVYALLFVVIFVVALFFSLKNLQSVDVNLFIGTITMPLALALTVELLAGVAIGVGFQLIYVLRLRAENGRLKKNLVLAEQELAALHEQPSAND